MAAQLVSVNEKHGRFGLQMMELFKDRGRNFFNESVKAGLDTFSALNRQCIIKVNNELPAGTGIRLKNHPIYMGIWQTQQGEHDLIKSGESKVWRARKAYDRPTGCSGMLTFTVMHGECRSEYFVAIAFRNQSVQIRPSARNKVAVAILPYNHEDQISPLYHDMIDHWDRSKAKRKCPREIPYRAAFARDGSATIENDEIEVKCAIDSKNAAEVIVIFRKAADVAQNNIKRI